MVSFTLGCGALNRLLAALGQLGWAQRPRFAVEASVAAQGLVQALQQSIRSRRHPLWIAGFGVILAAFGRRAALLCKAAASALSQQQPLPDPMRSGVSERSFTAPATRRRIAMYF
jgi:hypothetical protein